MKATLSRPTTFLLLSLASIIPLAAEEKSPPKTDITLEEIIFDAEYLKKFIGANTLVVPAKEKSGLSEMAAKALGETGIGAKTKIFLFPPEAKRPELVSSIPHNYPRGRLLDRGTRADFLAFIGADGAVKCLYSYHNTEKIFAIAAAQAIVRWRYEPAKIQGKAVPVLAEINYDPSLDDTLLHRLRGPHNPISVRGNPSPPPAITRGTTPKMSPK